MLGRSHHPYLTQQHDPQTMQITLTRDLSALKGIYVTNKDPICPTRAVFGSQRKQQHQVTKASYAGQVRTSTVL